MSRISLISLIVLVAACSGGNRTAGGATLEGTVQGPTTALTVDVPGTASSTRTDASGHFAMVGVPEGETEVHFSGAGVDATLHIAALSKREHRQISVSVSGHDATEHLEASEVELRGSIESITAPSFALGGKTVVTTTATQFEKDGTAIAFADLTVGEQVEAEGALQADGSLLARSVKVEDQKAGEEGPEDVSFEGALNAISGTTLTVGTITVTTSDGTRVEKAGQMVDVSALAVGDELEVQGALQQDGSVAASEIHVMSIEEEAEARIEGAVAAVSSADSTLTVGTTVVHVDANTQFSGDGSFASLADVQVGDLVEIEALAQADGALLAKKVERLDH